MQFACKVLLDMHSTQQLDEPTTLRLLNRFLVQMKPASLSQVCHEVYQQVLKAGMTSENVAARKNATFLFVTIYQVLGRDKFTSLFRTLPQSQI